MTPKSPLDSLFSHPSLKQGWQILKSDNPGSFTKSQGLKVYDWFKFKPSVSMIIRIALFEMSVKPCIIQIWQTLRLAYVQLGVIFLPLRHTHKIQLPRYDDTNCMSMAGDIDDITFPAKYQTMYHRQCLLNNSDSALNSMFALGSCYVSSPNACTNILPPSYLQAWKKLRECVGWKHVRVHMWL